MNTIALLLSLLAPTLSVPLLGDQAYPESLDYRASTGSLFVSASGNGAVEEINAAGVASLFLPPLSDGRTEAYGVKVDDARGRLWLIDGKTIFIYSLADKSLLAKIARADLGAVADSFLNDLALDAEGNAYITDSRDPNLVLVDGTSLKARLRPLPGIPFGNQNSVRYNLNGIVLAAAERALYSVKTNDGSLWRIPLDPAAAPTPVPLTAPLLFGDGLCWGPGEDLLVMRNYANKVSRVHLGAARPADPRVVEDLDLGGIATPTGCVYYRDPHAGGMWLAIANSQFAADTPALPFQVGIYSL